MNKKVVLLLILLFIFGIVNYLALRRVLLEPGGQKPIMPQQPNVIPNQQGTSDETVEI